MTANHGPNRDDSFTPMPRDEGISGDLGVAEVGTTEQIAARYCPETGTVYFPAVNPAKADPLRKGGRRDDEHVLPMEPSPASAERRLRKLKSVRVLGRRGHTTSTGRTSIWMLSKAAFRREAKYMGRPDDNYPGWPKRVQHLLDTNDVYFQLAGELDTILKGTCHGPDPVWEWRNEARAYERYSVSWEPRPRYHQPDAEILFCGNVFILERQTERSKKPAEIIAKKVLDHNARADYLDAKEQAKIIFACDTQRDVDNALRAGDDSDLPVVAASVEEVVSYLTDEALRLS